MMCMNDWRLSTLLPDGNPFLLEEAVRIPHPCPESISSVTLLVMLFGRVDDNLKKRVFGEHKELTMNVQQAATPRPLPDPQRQNNVADLRQDGRWLLLARAGWVSGLDLVSSLLLVTATGVWFAVSGLLLWSKSNDRVVVLFSLAFMLIGGVLLPSHSAAFLAGHSWGWELFLALIQSLAQAALLLFYLFPDGRFVPRWTRFLAFGWIIASLDLNVPSFINIGAFNPWNSSFSLALYRIVEVAFYGSFMFSLLYRYRRVSTPVQRQQTKWVIFAFLIILAAASAAVLEVEIIPYYFHAFTLPNQLASLVYLLAIWFLPVLSPVAIGIALLRYRLWTIDLIINRTLVYGVLTGTLIVVYTGTILLLQELLSGFTSGNTLALVASTLAIAVLVMPLRRRIQIIIDRRFYRRAYNATRTLEAFSATLRGEIDLNTLSEQLVAVVQETMQPTHVSLWLHQHGPQAQKSSRGLVMAEQARSRQPLRAKSATESAETLEKMSRPPSRGISRRAAMIGLAAGGIVVASGDLSWWLLWRHPIFTYIGHADKVYAVAWSPDGRRIASGSGDTKGRIWNPE